MRSQFVEAAPVARARPRRSVRDALRRFPRADERVLRSFQLDAAAIVNLEAEVALYVVQRDEERAVPRRAELRERLHRIASLARALGDELDGFATVTRSTKTWEQAQAEPALLPSDSRLNKKLRELAAAAAAADARTHHMPATKPEKIAQRRLTSSVKKLGLVRHAERAVLEACFRLANEPGRDVSPLLR
jgi:hypothetical protein